MCGHAMASYALECSTFDVANNQFCQSGAWGKGAASIGTHTLQITGYAGLFQGRGTFDSGTGTFTGELICDPATVTRYCGANGNMRCGSDASCAWNIAAYAGGAVSTWLIVEGNYYYRYGAGVAHVSALPVNTVTSY